MVTSVQFWILAVWCVSVALGEFTYRDIFSSDSEALLHAIIKPPNKAEKLQQLLTTMPPPSTYKLKITHNTASKPITPSNNVIMTAALSSTYTARDVSHFVGTARRTGFKGDIVVAILDKIEDKTLQRLYRFNATVLTVHDTACSGRDNILCTFMGRADIPVTLLRFFVFQDLLARYSPQSKVLLSDFRDVIFQSDPFRYKPLMNVWQRSNQIFMFQETHPNRVINRDSQNLYWISLCYGNGVARTIGTNTISTSGLVLGSRDAALAYSFLITTQMNPALRNMYNETLPDDHNCMRFGVDQGFHNVLLYQQVFSKFLDVKLYAQGEGPANIVGGFFGENKLLRAYLSEWKILRGEAPYKYIYNWNGEICPIVHQLDRFLYVFIRSFVRLFLVSLVRGRSSLLFDFCRNTELQGGYEKHMAVFQHLYG